MSTKEKKKKKLMRDNFDCTWCRVAKNSQSDGVGAATKLLLVRHTCDKSYEEILKYASIHDLVKKEETCDWVCAENAVAVWVLLHVPVDGLGARVVRRVVIIAVLACKRRVKQT